MKNILVIVQIVILILDLIKKGLEENEVISMVANEFDVSEEVIKRLF
ncbi:hypothetical protein [Clostridium sp. ZS1]|nr:hypothetical protein [Clostridium sp. ZS1]